MNELDKLRDIKGIENIDLTNPFWYLGAILALILVALLAYLFFKKRKKRYKFKKSPQELAKSRILNLNYSNPKEVAYTLSQDVEQFLDENQVEQLNSILKELEVYKYKKEVPKLDKELIKRIKELIGTIKWKV